MSTTVVTFHLSKEAITDIISLMESTLASAQTDVRDAAYLHTAAGKVLSKWLSDLGEGTECTFRSGKRLGRTYITLSAPGKKINPIDADGECVLNGNNSVQTLLANIGVAPSFQYVNGENQITLMPKRKKINPLLYLGGSAVIALIVGLFCTLLPAEIRTGLAEQVVGPLFTALVGILVAIALPMMFLSLMWGIYSMGDTATLGKLGKALIGRYLGRVFFTLIICVLVCAPFFTYVISLDMFSSTGDITSIYQMLLRLIPSNLITPFTEGNTLQIIFLAVVFGLAILVLNKKIPIVVQALGQLNSVIQLVMEWVTALLPILIFVSILNIMLKAAATGVSSIWILFVIVILCAVLNLAIMLASVCIRQKISPLLFMKKLIPTFIVSITTASSAAAFSTNMDTCSKKCGISKKLADFGVPLGTAFSRPGHAIMLFCVCLYMANQYQIPITLTWLVTAIIAAGLLAIAVPPVPGGGVAVYSILFLELGIPAEALAIAIVLDIVLDFIGTAVNMVAVPVDLTHVAGKMKMLDHHVLNSKTEESKQN